MKYLRNIGVRLPQAVILLFLAAAVFYRHHSIAQTQWQRSLDYSGPVLKQVQILFPGAASVKWETDPALLSAVYDSQGKNIGSFLFTSPYAGDIKGYAGPIPMVIGFDTENRITGLHLLPNNESKNFQAYLQSLEFFEKWNGLTPGEALGEPVDAVSRATMTSTAVRDSITRRLSLLGSGLRCGQTVAEQVPEPRMGPGDIASSSVLLLALFSFLFPRQSARLRWVLLSASVVVLGFWNGQFLSVSLMGGWAVNGVNWVFVPVLVFIALLAVLLPLVTGRKFYCIYLCPYGAAQELAGKISRRKKTVPAWLRSTLPGIKRLLVIFILLVLLVPLDYDLTFLEPFPAFLLQAVSAAVLIWALFFVLLSIIFPRFWCNYLCPTGQILELISRNFFKHRGPYKPENKAQ